MAKPITAGNRAPESKTPRKRPFRREHRFREYRAVQQIAQRQPEHGDGGISALGSA